MTFAGFTLIELLVVVAIIGLLISILVPSLSAARSQSKVAVCRGNLKSLGELIILYSQNNDDCIPRGPHFGPDPGNPLLAPYIATNQLWMGNSFSATFGGVTWNNPPQYIGLGLAVQQKGKTGNDFLFSPGDEQNHMDEESPKIGVDGVDAYGSYIYRQGDMLPSNVTDETTFDLAYPKRVLLQNLGSHKILDPTPTNPNNTTRIDVKALALTVNVLAPEPNRMIIHNQKRVNVLFVDGSTQSFENNPQTVSYPYLPDPTLKWATIPAEAFGTGVVQDIKNQLDRIFVAADYGYFNSEPWTAPVP